MRIAKVIGTITATVKDAQLTSKPLLLLDIVDGALKVITPAVVAVDTVGAGVGETVLIVQGTAARVPGSTASAPVDTTIIALVDDVRLGSAK